ncbi:MAG: hypothetical protein H0W88_09545 [Parachlamydiaceae bacterium]|nr:hypothetical protein [Parachlamydiaceae bacterium]
MVSPIKDYKPEEPIPTKKELTSLEKKMNKIIAEKEKRDDEVEKSSGNATAKPLSERISRGPITPKQKKESS